MKPVSFDGQVAIVTGGGRGLGRAYCLELGRRGASVVVNDVATEFADETTAEINAAGGKAVASHDSVATPAGGAALTALAVDSFGTIDVLINNAGILRNNYFEDLTLEQIDAVLDVNLRGAFFVTQPAWRVMKEKGYGRVLMTSSAAGMFSRPGSVNYSASKAAMYGMTRALSFEGADFGIKINMLLPRAATTITAQDPVPGMQANAQSQSPAARAALASRRAPEVTAPLVCYLVSRECAVTGEAFSSAFGSYARVFVGRAPGWLARDPDAISVEDIGDNIDTVRELDGYTVPSGNGAEVETVLEMLGVDVAAPS